MRPAANDDASATWRPSSGFLHKSNHGAHRIPGTPPQPAVSPISFTLFREDEIQRSTTMSCASDNSYGVQSFDAALDTAFGDEDTKCIRTNHTCSPVSRCTADQVDCWPKDTVQKFESSAHHVSIDVSSSQSPPPPFTPVRAHRSGYTSGLSSTPKSVSLKSLVPSDEESQPDETASQAMLTSDDENGGHAHEREVESIVPQLVMPSIQMPERRPFTENGKHMGTLKVLVAGDTGIGKTSFIRSIVQICDDIVHVDPIAATPYISQPHHQQTTESKRKKKPANIIEVYASTRAYPQWWSDGLDAADGRVLHRQKSACDAILERNLCFVDTPGFDSTKDARAQAEPIVRYIESALRRNAILGTMNDSSLLRVLSGSGGDQVDVVFYMLNPSDDIALPRSIEHIRHLSSLTNVIPIISRSDSLDKERIFSLKTIVLERLQDRGVEPFLFGNSVETALHATRAAFNGVAYNRSIKTSDVDFAPGPFAVTSVPVANSDIMDASLLMSSDYVRPLASSELTTLVSQVFNHDTIAWLRHSAAKKLLRWRSGRIQEEVSSMHSFRSNESSATLGFLSPACNINRSLSYRPPPSPSQTRVPQPKMRSTTNTPLSTTASSHIQTTPRSPYSAARGINYPLIQCNTQSYSDEQKAQVRLAKWAQNLQRSLLNERRRCVELEREKRTQWLLEQVKKEVLDGRTSLEKDLQSQLDPSRRFLSRGSGIYEHFKRACSWSAECEHFDHRDPLGLCKWGDDVKRDGWIVVQMLGSVGVLGAVAYAVCQWRSQESSGSLAG